MSRKEKDGITVRKIHFRTILVLLIAMAVIFGMGVFVYRIVMYSDQWIQHTYNGHLSGNGGLANAGIIYDRQGTVLAYSENSLRK